MGLRTDPTPRNSTTSALAEMDWKSEVELAASGRYDEHSIQIDDRNYVVRREIHTNAYKLYVVNDKCWEELTNWISLKDMKVIISQIRLYGLKMVLKYYQSC